MVNYLFLIISIVSALVISVCMLVNKGVVSKSIVSVASFMMALPLPLFCITALFNGQSSFIMTAPIALSGSFLWIAHNFFYNKKENLYLLASFVTVGANIAASIWCFSIGVAETAHTAIYSVCCLPFFIYAIIKYRQSSDKAFIVIRKTFSFLGAHKLIAIILILAIALGVYCPVSINIASNKLRGSQSDISNMLYFAPNIDTSPQGELRYLDDYFEKTPKKLRIARLNSLFLSSDKKEDIKALTEFFEEYPLYEVKEKLQYAESLQKHILEYSKAYDELLELDGKTIKHHSLVKKINLLKRAQNNAVSYLAKILNIKEEEIHIETPLVINELENHFADSFNESTIYLISLTYEAHQKKYYGVKVDERDDTIKEIAKYVKENKISLYSSADKYKDINTYPLCGAIILEGAEPLFEELSLQDHLGKYSIEQLED